MAGMTVNAPAARATRTPNEVEAQRAEARARLDDVQRYERVKAAAVLAAIGWLVDGDPAPITGGQLDATESAISTERLRAEDAEAAALRRGLDGTGPGIVGVVLSWYHRRPYTEAPY